MEDELKCPLCKKLYVNPVLLPCSHSLCFNCAIQTQQSVVANSSTSVSELSELTIDSNDSDKLSILSETDSGVVLNSTSRPSSYISAVHLLSSTSNALFYTLACPTCKKCVYFDENGALNLPRFTALQNIVDRYVESKTLGSICQLCEPNAASREAAVYCEQCQVFYCESCRENCHPGRGPLAKHNLVPAQQGRTIVRTIKERRKQEEHSEVGSRCPEHVEESLTHFCSTCKISVCQNCLRQGENPHQSHDIQQLSTLCKLQKTELSQSLQQLSEKAKSASEVIQQMKCSSERIHESCSAVEAAIHSQCEELVELLRRKEEALVEFARRERDVQLRRLREEVATCTARLQQTTATVQFCIEALKETDPGAFLQIGSILVNRVCNLDSGWRQEMVELKNRPVPSVELTLDHVPLRRSIEQLTFIEMKPPGAPQIVAEECSAENNSITVAWQPSPSSFVEGFVLELDDGSGGHFREVYCGKESVCTVDGLHFNSLYNARVKAFNGSGEGPYSDPIGLHTAEVAWFTFDPASSPPEARLSSDGTVATTDSFEPRVLLGSVGFSRGVHYWEFSVERYEGTADPAFGVARKDCSRELMLGKDDKGWSMYIDHQRSWFLHNNIHCSRTEGGIDVGSTVGVLLDLDRRQLSFYVNDEPQGSVAFDNLSGVFYPAVSLNRNVTVTLHSALDPPTSCPDSGEESDEPVSRNPITTSL